MQRKRGLIALTVMALVTLFGLAALQGMSQSAETPSDPLQFGSIDSARAVQQGVVDACAELPDKGLEKLNTWARLDADVWEQVDMAHIVAKGVITTIHSPRFDTVSGLVPTPLPTTATDADEDELKDRIVVPYVIDATNIYSGTAVDGYVVIRWGGTPADCPDYEYTREPTVLQGITGTTGMLFIWDPPASWDTSPPGWFSHAKSVADDLNNAGGNYVPVVADNWYKYDGSNAISEINGSETITDLENAVATATAP